MNIARAGVATTLPLAAETGDNASPSDLRLLVIGPTSSREVALPAEGFFVLGRARECDVILDDPSVSRKHARLVAQNGQARVVDLDSRNGVRVNGSAIHGAYALIAGDVIGIGDMTVMLRARGRPPSKRAILGPGEWMARLDHELERALEYARPLSVLVLSLGREAPGLGASSSESGEQRLVEAADDPSAILDALAQALRPIDLVGRTTRGEIAIILPELDAGEGRAAGELLLEAWEGHRRAAALQAQESGTLEKPTEARAGLAACPSDGCDADTLLEAARAAAHAGGPRTVAGSAERTQTVTLGDRQVIIADPAMIRIFALIERLAASPIPVLVAGETGTGKEHAALAVHLRSKRAAGTFIAVNCAAVPETLWESELFGFDKGAFSGAIAPKAGLFERADGGTLFLDEIGELSLPAQAKLLRVLETGNFRRIGEARERTVDVRIVAATNRNLAAEVVAHRFREDLLYRLGSAAVVIPPLRERRTEIPILAAHFLQSARRAANRAPLTLSPDALRALTAHPWPGNVRELKNAMDLCAATVPLGVVERRDLPDVIAGPAAATTTLPGESRAPSEPPADASFRPVAEELEELEKRRMREALAATGGVKTKAARLIHMPERTFRLKLRQYALDPGPGGHRQS